MYPEPKGTHYIIVGIVNKCFLFTIIIKGMQWGMGIQLESPVWMKGYKGYAPLSREWDLPQKLILKPFFPSRSLPLFWFHGAVENIITHIQPISDLTPLLNHAP